MHRLEALSPFVARGGRSRYLLAVKDVVQELEYQALVAKEHAFPERQRLDDDIATVDEDDLLPASYAPFVNESSNTDDSYYNVDSDRETRYSVWR